MIVLRANDEPADYAERVSGLYVRLTSRGYFDTQVRPWILSHTLSREIPETNRSWFTTQEITGRP